MKLEITNEMLLVFEQSNMIRLDYPLITFKQLF